MTSQSSQIHRATIAAVLDMLKFSPYFSKKKKKQHIVSMTTWWHSFGLRLLSMHKKISCFFFFLHLKQRLFDPDYLSRHHQQRLHTLSHRHTSADAILRM